MKYIFIIKLIIISILLTACDSNNTPAGTLADKQVVMPLNSKITAAIAANIDLQVDVIIDIGTPESVTYTLQNLQIDSINNTVSGTLDIVISDGMHTFDLVYILIGPNTTIQVASTQSVISEIKEGQIAAITISNIIDEPDTDEDGYSNLDEMLTGANPNDKSDIPPEAPVANAGDDKNVIQDSANVNLDGSTSSDKNGDALTYIWTLQTTPTGSGATLLNPTSEMSMLNHDLVGRYEISLVVNDGELDSESVTVVVIVTVKNIAPIAKAGADRRTEIAQKITLDGSASTDEDPSVNLTYAWSFQSVPAGGNALLSGANTDMPVFIPDKEGEYELQLDVTDDEFTDSDTITIKAYYLNSNLLADYQFNGNGNDSTGINSTMSLNNVTYISDYLNLNGIYQSNTGGFTASTFIKKFSYQAFTVFVDFNARTFDGVNDTIIVGGTSYRWFSLRVINNELQLTLNNQGFTHTFTGVNVSTKDWHQVAVSFNLASLSVSVQLDEVSLPVVTLPANFVLSIIGSQSDASDRKFTFTNFSNAKTLNGLADTLRIYNRALTQTELAKLVNNTEKNSPTPFVETRLKINAPPLPLEKDNSLIVKATCLVSGSDADTTSTICPVITTGNLTIWAFSYLDNRGAFDIVTYDENNSIVARMSNVGNARYIKDISINHTAKTVTLFGQGSSSTTLTWSQLGL